jgi:ABC-type sugar transport system substrate-binding protein
MKRKYFAVFWACLVLLQAGTAWANGRGEATESKVGTKSKTVAFCTMTAEGAYWNLLYDLTRDALKKLGYEMDLINANMNLPTQIEQIENCVTQGYAGILTIAVDPEGIGDATRRAISRGVPVLAFIKNPGTGNYTAFRGADEKYVGETVVGIGSEWAKEHFGSEKVRVLVVGGNSVGSETERYEGMDASAKANSQFIVVNSVRWETSQATAMQACENELTRLRGGVDIIFCGSGEMGLGVRQAVMAANSPIKNYKDFGIFTADISAESAAAIRASKEDKDVIRGAAVNGGILSEACAEMAQQMIDCINGTNKTDFYHVTAYIATPDNIAQFGF